MADKTITQLTATTSAVGADEIPLWVAGSAVTRKITKANFLQGAFTGGGTVATGGFTLTVPATGTAALLATANVFTAAQTGIAVPIGSRRAASGAGAQIGYTGPAATTYSLGAGASFTFQFDGDGCLFVLSFGYAAVLFAPYNSSTIVEIADPGNAIPAVFTVTKSVNGRIITVTNASGGAIACSVMVLGNVASHT